MAPSPPLQWLTTLKSSQLKALATATGTPSSGTKPALIASLQAHLPSGFFPPRSTPANNNNDNDNNYSNTKEKTTTSQEIISIDMGIRNLAYCRISLPPNWPPPSHQPQNGNKSSTTSQSQQRSLPTITQWARIAISSNPNAPPSTTRKKSKTSNPTPTTITTTTDPHQPTGKEPFDPRTLSHHAYNLATHLLFPSSPHPPPQPTQILIERQRFRSMGGSAVQEWTLRVNMFEAMIYAVLRTLAQEGKWVAGRDGGVFAVEPGRVARFWVGEAGDEGDAVGGNPKIAVVDNEEKEEEGDDEDDVNLDKHATTPTRRKKKTVSKSARTKLAKIKVVESWLEDIFSSSGKGGSRARFVLEGSAKELGEGFLRKRKGGRDVRVRQERVGEIQGEGGGDEAEIGKLDDLADALLQGMAWVKWEENRRRVLESGEDAFGRLQ